MIAATRYEVVSMLRSLSTMSATKRPIKADRKKIAVLMRNRITTGLPFVGVCPRQRALRVSSAWRLVD